MFSVIYYIYIYVLYTVYKINFFYTLLPALKDINECSLQGVCQNGDCLNTLGSFKCSCKAGSVLVRNRCVGTYVGFLTSCTT